MRRGMARALALVMSAAMLIGCGKDEPSGSSAEKYVTLPEYKGIEIDISTVDEILDVMAAQFYFNSVEFPGEITDRPVKRYDLANIDYEGKKDGIAFAGGTAQGADLLIGSGTFIEGFEEGLVGAAPGETVDLNLRFPDNYGNAELVGQEVVFTVTVNYVSEMQDGQVAAIGIENVETIEQLREYLREDAEEEYFQAAGDAVLAQVVEKSVYTELPEEMLAENRQLYSDWLDQMAQYYGTDARTYTAWFGMDYESALTQYAEEYTKQQLLIQAVADREGLNISDQELDERLSGYAKEVYVTVEDLLANNLTKEDYRESFLYEDVMNYLVENAVNIREK